MKIAEIMTLSLGIEALLESGGNLMVLPHGSQETSIARSLVDLLPPRRAVVGRKKTCKNTSSTRPPSFFETPIVRHITSHSLHLGSPSLARVG